MFKPVGVAHAETKPKKEDRLAQLIKESKAILKVCLHNLKRVYASIHSQ